MTTELLIKQLIELAECASIVSDHADEQHYIAKKGGHVMIAAAKLETSHINEQILKLALDVAKVLAGEDETLIQKRIERYVDEHDAVREKKGLPT